MASSNQPDARDIMAGIRLILEEMRDDRRRADLRFEEVVRRSDDRMEAIARRSDERLEILAERWDEDRKRFNRTVLIAVQVAKDIRRTLKEHSVMLRAIARSLRTGSNGHGRNGK